MVSAPPEAFMLLRMESPADDMHFRWMPGANQPPPDHDNGDAGFDQPVEHAPLASVAGDTSVAPPPGALETPPGAVARSSAATNNVPVDAARTAAYTAPTLLVAALPQVGHPSQLQAEGTASGALAAAAAEHSLPGGTDALILGVPAPAEIAAITPPIGSAEASDSAVPPGVPWLAGLLTPTATLVVEEPLLALQRFVGDAEGLGHATFGRLTALLSSPWTAGVVVAIAAVDFGRRRVRRTGRQHPAIDVPDITGPSQLT